MTHKLWFGPAGIPQAAKGKGIVEGVNALPSLGLDAMELEFVQQVYLKEEKAREVNEARKKHNIRLSVHAPYYINLNAREPKTMEASIERLYLAGKMGGLAGAESVAVHAAFRHEQDSKTIAHKVEKAILGIASRLEKENISIFISPEFAGKHSQWGTLEEVMEMAQHPKISWCMDFGHAHATSNGSLTSKEKFDALLQKIEKFDSTYLEDLHIQACGITFSDKGERVHTPFESSESTLNWKAMMQSLKEFNVGGMFIAETPTPTEDAQMAKNYYATL